MAVIFLRSRRICGSALNSTQHHARQTAAVRRHQRVFGRDLAVGNFDLGQLNQLQNRHVQLARGQSGRRRCRALCLLVCHGTLLAAVGEDGARSYTTALPLRSDRSDIARR